MTHLDDPLEDLFNQSAAAQAEPRADNVIPLRTTMPGEERFAAGYTEPCRAKGCRNGTFYSWSGRAVGPCYTCKGKGTMTFKTSPQQRAADAVNRNAVKLRKGQEAEEAFAIEHPEVAIWLKSDDAFARSLRDALHKYGSLTDKQLAAAYRADAAQRGRRERRQAAIDNAPSISVTPIVEAFARARAKGVKKPFMAMDGFMFERASDRGRNPGAIYVVGGKGHNGDAYFGKIVDGKFHRGRDATDEIVAQIMEVARDPETAAKAYGKKFGICCICKRDLTNPASIEAGIGPVCSANMGW